MFPELISKSLLNNLINANENIKEEIKKSLHTQGVMLIEPSDDINFDADESEIVDDCNELSENHIFLDQDEDLYH